MRRRLFAIASVFSLLLCVALVASWVRSYRECIELAGTSWVKSLDGEIEVVRMIELSGPANQTDESSQGESLEPDPPKPIEFHQQPTGALMMEPDAFGFGYTKGTHFFAQDERFYESTWTCYVVPYWLLVAITAFLPAAWVFNRRRIRRRQARLTITRPTGEQPQTS